MANTRESETTPRVDGKRRAVGLIDLQAATKACLSDDGMPAVHAAIIAVLKASGSM